MQLGLLAQSNPFSRLFLFLVLGIICAFLVGFSLAATVFCSVVCLLFFVTLIFINRRPVYHTGYFAGFFAAVFFLLGGFINMEIHFLNASNQEKINPAKPQKLFLEILEPPEETAKSYKSVARLLTAANTSQHAGIRIIIYFEKDNSSGKLQPGSRICAFCSLDPIPKAANPDEFDYKGYMAARDIYCQTWLGRGAWYLTPYPHQSLRTLAHKARQNVLAIYQKAEQNHTLYGLLSALTLGYKSDLDAQTKSAFSRAGVLHVMALSGFNVAIIAFATGYLLFFLDRYVYGKLIKIILIITLIWIFAFITGLSPSVTRASVMISLVMTGNFLERRINTLNILFATAFILLAFRPALVFDVSFQLSFCAVLGILALYPLLNSLFVPRIWILGRLWQLFSVSCAAQIATLPLTLFYFHQFPVYFWLTNLFVIPLVSVIICMSGLLLLVSFIHPLFLVIGYLLHLLMNILHQSVSIAGNLPFAVLEHIYLSKLQVFVLFTFIVTMGYLIKNRNRYGFVMASVLFLTFQLMYILRDLQINQQRIIMIGSCRKVTVIHVLSGRHATVLTSGHISEKDEVLQYAFENWWIRHGVAAHLENRKLQDVTQLEVNHTRINILNRSPVNQPKQPVESDITVITGNVKPNAGILKRHFMSSLVILDSSVDNLQTREWIKVCESQNIACWPVKLKGAFLLKLN